MFRYTPTDLDLRVSAAFTTPSSMFPAQELTEWLTSCRSIFFKIAIALGLGG
jgi:hypothetical protein